MSCDADVMKCFHEECNKIGKCFQVCSLPTKLLLQNDHVSVEIFEKVNLPIETRSKPSKCSYGKVKCQNHQVCSILGQCAKSHPEIWKHKLKHLFYKKVSVKQAIKIFEPIMPLKVPFKDRKREYKHLE